MKQLFSKNGIKEAVTRVIAFSICFTMSLTSAIPTFASGAATSGAVSGAVGGGGNSSMNSTSDSKFWSRNFAGYRFYMIDKDFVRVTPIYDFVFTDPTSASSNVGEALSNTRFDGAGTPAGWDIKMISELAAATGSSVSDIPVPIADGKGQGELFREWFLQGQGGGGSVISGTTLIPNSTKITQSQTTTQTNTSSTSNGVAQQSGKSTLVSSYISVGEVASSMAEAGSPARSLTEKDRKTCVNSLGTSIDLYKIYYDKAPEGLSNSDAHNYALGRLYNSLSDANYSLNQSLFLIGFVDRMNPNNAMWVSLPWEDKEGSSDNNLLNYNIPLTNADNKSTSLPDSPAVKLLNDSHAIQVPGYESAAEALITGDYYLIVEPIAWINLQHTAGNWNSNYNSYRTYGSYYNIASKWGGNANGGFYKSYMSELGNNCMIVTGTIETSTGKIMSPVSIQTRNIGQSVAEMNSRNPYLGLSMHLYSSESLLGEIGLTIIKNYIDENGAVCKDNVVEVSTSSSYSITDEGNYEVVQWETSTNNPPKQIGDRTPWEPITETSTNTQGGLTPTTVTVTPEEKVIYIQLQLNPEAPIEADWVIEESEITKQFSTLTNTKTKDIPSIYLEIGRLDDTHEHPDTDYCSSSSPCEDTDGDGNADSCPGHDATEYFDMSLADKSIKAILENTSRESFPKVVAFNDIFLDKINPEKFDFSRDSHDATTEKIELNEYKFIGHRGEDKLKVAGFKAENQSHASILSTLGYAQADKNTNPNRKKTTYTAVINIVLEVNNGLSDLMTSSTCVECGTTDNDESNQQSPVALNNNEITIKVYSGRSTSTDKEVNNNPKLGFGLSNFPNTFGRMVQSDSKIQFYPYIQMTYVTLDSNKQNVFVLSEFQRTVIPNDYAEIAWGETTENLRITSNQWSTHAGALELSKEIFGAARPNIMLPGGAVYSLDTKTSDGRKQNLRRILFNTYQTIVPEVTEVVASTTVTDGELTEAGAINAHELFVNNGFINLSNSYLKMFVTTELNAENAWDSGIEVFNGADIRKLDNGSSQASLDDKYYFKQKNQLEIGVNGNGEQQVPANCGTFDVNIKGKNTVYHRVFSDTKGNVMYVSGADLNSVMAAESGTVLFKKTQNYSLEAISVGKAKMIDQRTGFIRKFMTTIERNSGNDTTAAWAPDGTWYNEAYKGIVVIEQSTPVEVGLVYPDLRSTVMDPKLIPKVTSKMERDSSGNLAFEAYMFQYKTSLSEDEPISSFKGIDVYMKNADELFKSNKAFIINMTVQDLS